MGKSRKSRNRKKGRKAGWSRQRRSAPQSRPKIYDLRMDLTTGEERITEIPRALQAAHAHYIQCHSLLPPDLICWSLAEVEREVDVLRRRASPVDWKRAMIILAHHSSEGAIELLLALKDDIPEELSHFWEAAYDEALGWLGQQDHSPIFAVSTSPDQPLN